MLRTATSRFLLLLVLLALAPSAYAQSERILDFHSEIQVLPSGEMQVTETIRVLSESKSIRHGIYRDFPTHYVDHFNNNYNVGFEFLSATCDGYAEESRVEPASNGVRIYLGNQKTFVGNGEHTYTIVYSTNRQLGFFADHDELFWNVTGLGWDFRIDHASATVHLPAAMPVERVQLSGYTGPQGSRAHNLTTQTNDDGSFSFATTIPLRPRQGLTILLEFPKGYFAPPTTQQKAAYFFRDNRDALIFFAGFLVVLVYYIIVWSAVGRDPAPGVIMPRYEPPANLSPAAMRYLVRMGYDNKTLSAAILDMAVRGYITISESTGTYNLHRTNADSSVLTPDEKILVATLFDGRFELWLHNTNHTVIAAGIKDLKAWLKSSEQKIYFFTNGRYMIPAIVLSVICFASGFALRGGPQVFLIIFLCFWLSIWSLALTGLFFGCYQQWKAAFSSPTAKTLLAGKALLLSLFSIPFLAAEIFAIFAFTKITSPLAVGVLLSSVGLHILFHFLLKAPTSAGRQLLDQVEGFKMFLGAVDADRLNRAMPPDQTPKTFEKFLPYALALDVEQAWAEKFSGVLAAAGQSPGSDHAGYTPSFYSGAALAGGSFGSFTSSLGSFTSSISSSASAPGSSGGSGGGSGGGGGGGGGGGW